MADASLRERIERNVFINELTGCWLWLGSCDRHGYGRLTVDRKPRLAHRLSYEIFIGPVPVGLELDHECDRRECVNPKHVVPKTHRENMLRGGRGVGAINARKVRCEHGHPFDEKNTYRHRSRRSCRACNAKAAKRYKKRRAVLDPPRQEAGM